MRRPIVAAMAPASRSVALADVNDAFGNSRIARAQRGLRDWTGDLLRGEGRLSTWGAWALVAAVTALSWLLTYLLGGADRVAPHWFYLGILYGAARFGFFGAVATGVVSGIVAGPLTLHDVDAGTAQTTSSWVSRMGFFVGIGVVMAALLLRLRTALLREMEIHEREHELARRSAAVIQSVGHEFRTPLTVLSGTVQVLQGRELDPDDQAQFVEGMANAVQRLDDLTSIVIATSEVVSGDHGSREVVDVRAVLERVAGQLAAHDAERRLSLPATSCLVLGDARLVEVALRALVENALKFSSTDVPVLVTIERADGQVAVAVEDRGPGIDLDVVAVATRMPFAPDRLTAATGGGLGLGLFTACQALRRMEGALQFERPAAGGTRAVVLLPAAPGA
ncbi:MAG TPA: sensor histidine kinase [Acidimicrobiia bacterium]|nr:sensor histidine kinase [Acidimicrobiia bacterium]